MTPECAGDSVKLIDLARLMIQLSGNTVLDEREQEAGIEIREIGLRPGEKLYEELLISDNVLGTKHPKIMRAVEEKLTATMLGKSLATLEKCIETHDKSSAIQEFRDHVGLQNGT